MRTGIVYVPGTPLGAGGVRWHSELFRKACQGSSVLPPKSLSAQMRTSDEGNGT